MTLTNRMAALAMVMAVLAGCTPTSAPARYKSSDDKRTTFRRPALQGLALEEGLNVIDHTPAGPSLVARVVGGEITEWQAFDADGAVVMAMKKNDDDIPGGYCHVCELTGGECSEISVEKACCWIGWGCQVCDGKGKNCKMECETPACEDANSQPGKRGGGPDDGPIATVLPDGSRTFFEPGASRWIMTRPTGERIHVPLATSVNDCAVCTARAGNNVCWALPCLPAKTSAFR